MDLGEMMLSLWESTGFASSTWQNYVMLLISFVLFYLAIARKFEPLLLVPIAFGMLLANIPGAHDVLYESPLTTYTEVLDDNGALLGYEATYVRTGGLFYYLSKGVEWVIFPPLIFLGIGAMTDFGPLIANPKSLLLGAGAQLGIFVALALGFLAFDSAALAASVAIIGGADGPTKRLIRFFRLSPGDVLSLLPFNTMHGGQVHRRLQGMTPIHAARFHNTSGRSSQRYLPYGFSICRRVA